MNEQYKRIALSLGLGVATGFSLVGIFTLILSSAEFRSPEKFSNTHLNATKEETLSEWSKYSDSQFHGTMTVVTLATLVMTVLFGVIFRVCLSNSGAPSESAIVGERQPTASIGQSLTNPRNYLFGGSASLTLGFTFSGAISFLKAIFLRDYPKRYFKEFSPTEAELLQKWSAYIKDDLYLTLAIALASFLVMAPAFAVAKRHFPFWCYPSKNLGEDRPLLTGGNDMPLENRNSLTAELPRL